MANIEVTLPQMGEGVIEATITRWLVEQDSYIEEDEPIVEIATDKVDSEIPSPVKGKIVRFFFNEGETPKVGDVIAIINTRKNGTEKNVHEVPVSFESKEIGSLKDADVSDLLSGELILSAKTNEDGYISPFIRNYAKQRGISYNELIEISGSGTNGEIRKDDVLNYFKSRKMLINNKKQNSTEYKPNKNSISPEYKLKEGEEFIEIDKTRRLIAEHMVRSVHEAPHVTSIIESDITHIVQWRERIKDYFLTTNGVKLTYTPIITEVVVKALKEFPGINVSFIQDKIVLKKYINIGIATALPDHNLIVPVVRNADKKNLVKLAIEIADLTSRARHNDLKPGETNEGTFTITNLGMVGNITGTPIINQPESAILAVGAIKKRPWAVEIDGEYTVGIRDILTLSLSYDHRVIDGALGGAFLSRIGQLLESYSPDS